MRFAPKTLCALAVLTAAGCRPKQPAEVHFYDQHIQPIFNNFCTGNTSPCHRVDKPGTGGVALGNLDLTSFANVQKRRDVLRTYGSYPQPLLLLKALPEDTVFIPYRDGCCPARSSTPAASPSRPTPTPTTSSNGGSTTAPTSTASPPRRKRTRGSASVRRRCPRATSPRRWR